MFHSSLLLVELSSKDNTIKIEVSRSWGPGVVDIKHMTCRSCSSASRAECDITVNIKIVFLVLQALHKKQEIMQIKPKGYWKKMECLERWLVVGRIVI